ncbi:hypothetical protein [Alloactinosynnema sp. L-07]|uniref:hypothetical protein n=1 Tax=Alloactinosynnema sp. L-07 TaxID=1653480 RepID=UPI00065F0983|nr:hypothetical protein [Alloactinosynnema sp. L-07]CRK59080.1 hypothetical protein [Alloactinosynnema sp. L-07]
MASSSVGNLADAIPLLDDAGGGSYIRGRNTAADIRAGLVLGLTAPSASSASARQGVFGRKWNVSSDRWEDLFVRADGSPTRNVIVQAGTAIVTKSGSPYITWVAADTTVQLSNSNGANPRIDLVCARVCDKGTTPGDPVHGPVIWQEEGTPAGSPVAPATPAGAIVLAEVFRAAGATGDQLVQGNITDKRKGTAWHGTPRILLPGDSLADAGGYHDELRRRTGSFVAAPLVTAGYIDLIDRWSDEDSKWHGTQELVHAAELGANSALEFVDYSVMNMVLPDPGWDYRIVSGVDWHGLCGSPVTFTVSAKLTSIAGTQIGRPFVYSAGSAGSDGVAGPPAHADLNSFRSGRSAVLSGSQTVHMAVNRFAGASGVRTWSVGTGMTLRQVPA